eukprot:1432233-Rhodomonas_salina.1
MSPVIRNTRVGIPIGTALRVKFPEGSPGTGYLGALQQCELGGLTSTFAGGETGRAGKCGIPVLGYPCTHTLMAVTR